MTAGKITIPQSYLRLGALPPLIVAVARHRSRGIGFAVFGFGFSDRVSAIMFQLDGYVAAIMISEFG